MLESDKFISKCFFLFFALFGAVFVFISVYMIIIIGNMGIFGMVFAIPFIAGGGLFFFIGIKGLFSRSDSTSTGRRYQTLVRSYNSDGSTKTERDYLSSSKQNDLSYCSYCGTVFNESEKCPNCGAYRKK